MGKTIENLKIASAPHPRESIQGWKICVFPSNVVAFPASSYVFLFLKMHDFSPNCKWSFLISTFFHTMGIMHINNSAISGADFYPTGNDITRLLHGHRGHSQTVFIHLWQVFWKFVADKQTMCITESSVHIIIVSLCY